MDVVVQVEHGVEDNATCDREVGHPLKQLDGHDGERDEDSAHRSRWGEQRHGCVLLRSG